MRSSCLGFDHRRAADGEPQAERGRIDASSSGRPHVCGPSSRPGLVVGHEVGKREQTAYQTRFRVLHGTVEELVMVEVKIDHATIDVDRKRRDIMPEVTPALI